MPDRLERDIEDVLEKIEDFEWRRRRRRGPSRARQSWDALMRRISDRLAFVFVRFTSGRLMLVGFLLLAVGLALRARGPGAWLLLAGVIFFVLGLAWSMRGPKSRAPHEGRGGFWRDRYIEYDDYGEPRPGGVRGWFRRWRH